MKNLIKNSKIHATSSKVVFHSIALAIGLMLSCSNSDDATVPEVAVTFTTVSGNEISMDGLWRSDCALATNNLILKETFTFENDRFVIDINSYDNLQCDGEILSNEIVNVQFTHAGTTSIDFAGNPTRVNRIDGTATYAGGRQEVIKQVFLVDDTSGSTFMYHAKFADDGGATDAQGYPIDIIAIPLFKAQ